MRFIIAGTLDIDGHGKDITISDIDTGEEHIIKDFTFSLVLETQSKTGARGELEILGEWKD